MTDWKAMYITEAACHGRLEKELQKLTAWVADKGAKGFLVTLGAPKPEDLETMKLGGFMRSAIPDAARATPNGVPVNKGPCLRADRPALTVEERRACQVAVIAAPSEVRNLLAIIERLTGEKFEDRT